jgi:hypothetical protein
MKEKFAAAAAANAVPAADPARFFGCFANCK